MIFGKFDWSAWKLLDWRILLQIPQGFWEPWTAPRPPTARCAIRDASRRTPLWKFLPTGLLSVMYLEWFIIICNNMYFTYCFRNRMFNKRGYYQKQNLKKNPTHHRQRQLPTSVSNVMSVISIFMLPPFPSPAKQQVIYWYIWFV